MNGIAESGVSTKPRNMRRHGAMAGGARTLVMLLTFFTVGVVGLLIWLGRKGSEGGAVPPADPGLAAAASSRGQWAADGGVAQGGGVVALSTGPLTDTAIPPPSSGFARMATSSRESPGISADPAQVSRAGSGARVAPGDVISVLGDTSKPLEERERFVADLAKRGDADAVSALKATANAEIYLNWAAVKALGEIRNPSSAAMAADFLREKLSDSDSRVACEAIRSYGRLMGEKAVDGIGPAIAMNRGRPDGHEELVATAAVQTLNEIGSKKAEAILVEELDRGAGKGWSLEYGSRLVTALEAVGGEQGHRAVLTYASKLSDGMPDDPLAREYYETKIAKAREAATALQTRRER